MTWMPGDLVETYASMFNVFESATIMTDGHYRGSNETIIDLIDREPLYGIIISHPRPHALYVVFPNIIGWLNSANINVLLERPNP